MNKIFKVIYSKTKHMYVVASELAKSHSKSKNEGATSGKALAALVMAALASVSFMAAPMTAEAANKTHGSDFIGVQHTDDEESSSTSQNYQGGIGNNNQGALGTHAITIGVNTTAGDYTINIGDRLAPTTKHSVYIGSKYDADSTVHQETGNEVVSLGYNSDASGTGSIAIGYGAEADTFENKGSGTNPNKNSQSIAFGYEATAKGNNIAIGANSEATDAASSLGAAKYRETTDADYKATSYVSVGSSDVKRRITNVAAGSDANDAATVGQLEKVAAQKGSWQLTAGGTNKSTVDGDHNKVDFSAGSDGNLSVSKTADSNNVTIGLKKDVKLGEATSGNGGSLSIYQYTGDIDAKDKENGYDQLGTHTLLDGSTISVRYNNGSTDSDARGVVLGIAKDALLDKDGNETKTSPLGYVYLTDNGKYYYIHGTTLKDDKDHKELAGRLVYESEDKGYNYIADLDDGLKVTGDTAGTTVTTSLNPEAKNNTLSITGGEKDSSKLTTGNIGVVATAATDTAGGNLNIRLAKDLTGITSIANGADGSGAKITLGTSGTTISGGDVDVSNNKITGLKDGTATTDAATVGQMNTAIGDAKTKYYSVQKGPQIDGFSTNEKNDGASAWAGLAAGYETGTAGIGSTVVGSYSGVMNEGTSEGTDLRGAASISLGTLNLNQSTSTTAAGDNKKPYSGVANSIVGQGNMTTDSNAALIFGAGNTVSNSYRNVDINTSTMKGSTPSDLETALQTAVPNSGAQVMVMGGGNKITSAYMTQVIGVGNKVTGSDTTYAADTSTQYNYVDGSNNTLTNGKSDYIIGANNSVTGDSIDKNQSNIVVGDNHTLTNRKNNIVIGSADKKNDKNKELAASDAVVIGHNADVSVDGGVAIGSGSVSTATAEADAEGYDPIASAKNNKASTDTSATWKATSGAVSIGGVNGDTTTTRRITNLAAGFNDTDAVNVAQIKNLANMDASNVGWHMKNTTEDAKRANAVKWAGAIGRGKIANPDDDDAYDKTANGSHELVTGGTMFKDLKEALNNSSSELVHRDYTTAMNLKNLAVNTVQYQQNNKSVGASGQIESDFAEIHLNGNQPAQENYGTAITNLRSALKDAEGNPLIDKDGKVITLATATHDSQPHSSHSDIIDVTDDDVLRNAVNLGDLQEAYNLDAHVDASNIGANLKKADGTAAEATDVTNNKKAWAEAIGTGTVTKDDDGSKQMVTGSTVYNEVRPTTDGTYVKIAQTTAQNLSALDTQVKKNADDLSTMDSRSVKYDLQADGKTVDKTKITLGDGKNDTTVTHVKSALADAKDSSGNAATIATATGDSLKNAVNLGDLQTAYTTLDKKAGAHTALTVEGGKAADSTKDQYAGKNIQLHSDTDAATGKVTYDVKLANNLTGITSISGSTDDKGAKITLDTTDKNISVNGGSIKEVASNLTKDANGKYTVAENSSGNAANMGDVQNLVNQTVADAAYNSGDGITVDNDKKTISVNNGDGLTFKDKKLVVNTGDGLEIDNKTKALKIKASDSNLKVNQNGIGLNNVITIGTAGKDAHPITIDGTKGEVSGLNNTTWDSKGDYSKSTKAATESQVAQAMSDAVKQAGENDTHVAAGTYAVGTITTDDGKTEQGVSMEIVDKNDKKSGTVIIKDIAKASDMGNVSKLADGVKNADGTTTTVVDAINNVNTKIGDQQYYKGDDTGHTVKNGDSITSAIGKLDSAVQNAAAEAGKHATVSADETSNITVTPETQTDGHINYKVDMKKDISVDSVTAKTVTADNATIGGVTIKDQTISGLKDTDIKDGSTDAVNANTIYHELRPTDDGSYIKKDNNTAQNLVSLDTQVKKTADLINSDGKTIKIGGSDTATKIDVSGKDSSGNSTTRIITGIQTDANDASSAANVGYVNDVTAQNTQQIYRDMNSAYGHLNNNINKAAAGSNALAALHPLDYDPDDKASYAVGYGHYRNANAAAVGAFYQPNANTMVSVGVSMGNGDPGVNAGVSFKVGKGSAYNGMSKVEMAETIQSQAQKIDNLEKENQEMKKQIQEILAKLGK